MGSYNIPKQLLNFRDFLSIMKNFYSVTMPVIIVTADLNNPEHSAAIPAVINAYAADPMGGGKPLDPVRLQEIVPGLRKHSSSLVLLAFAGEQPVGIANCFVGFSTFAAKPLVNIHDLAVMPGCRGQGIGRQLLEAAETKARELGCCKLTLEVRADNNRAREIYKQYGFGDFTTGAETVPTYFLEKKISEKV